MHQDFFLNETYVFLWKTFSRINPERSTEHVEVQSRSIYIALCPMPSLFDDLENKSFSILELNNTVRGLIRNFFPEYIWVHGEIQDFNQRNHINFNLVQKDSDTDQIVAQVPAVIFANNKPRILSRLKDAGNPFELKKDLEVKFLCKVDLYPKNGKFSLTVFDIDPIFTAGKVALNRQKIINELKKKGLIEKNKEKQLPPIPLKVGLITSKSSAAFADFENELTLCGFSFKVFVYDSYMQGKNVEDCVIKGLELFNNFKENELDVVVITRGGGSTADLGWFDNQKIAVAIANSKFVVLTALGHQINETIADMVAHTTLKTPTKAAQYLVDLVDQQNRKIEELKEDIFITACDYLQSQKLSLETKSIKIESLLSRSFNIYREEIVNKKAILTVLGKRFFENKRRQMDEKGKNLLDVVSLSLKNSKDKISQISKLISFVDPKNILKRGFSVAIKDGKAIKNIADINLGDKIKTVFFKGEAISSIEETKE